MQDHLGLMEWQVDEETERQGGFDGGVGVLLLPPRVPAAAGAQVAIASGDSHSVTSPRPTGARLQEAQFATRYVVLSVGKTLEFIPPVWSRRPEDQANLGLWTSQPLGFMHEPRRSSCRSICRLMAAVRAQSIRLAAGLARSTRQALPLSRRIAQNEICFRSGAVAVRCGEVESRA